MKLSAALDHERTPLAERKPRGEKHAQTQALARQFSGEPTMARIRTAIDELFVAPEQAGLRTIALEARKVGSTALELDLFSALLGELFGSTAA